MMQVGNVGCIRQVFKGKQVVRLDEQVNAGVGIPALALEPDLLMIGQQRGIRLCGIAHPNPHPSTSLDQRIALDA